MLWIKSSVDLAGHPKLYKLMSILKVNQNEAIGIMHRFWWWCLQYAETGDLSEVDSTVLNTTLGTHNILETMIECKFVDNEPLQVHDWFDFAFEYLKSKYRTSNPEKYEKLLALRHKKQYSTKYSTKSGQDKIRLDKIRIDKIKEKERKPKNRKSLFKSILSRYPNKIRHKDAKRHFDATVKTVGDWERINTALGNYLAHLKNTAWKSPQNCSTWFNNWDGWVDHKEPGQEQADAEKQRIEELNRRAREALNR